jgi:glycerol 3-phosphatase-2
VAWVIDLDGVVWLGDRAIPGSADALAELRRGGTEVLFLTNNSSMRLGDYVAKLDGMGIAADPGQVMSSAQAAASLLSEGSSAVVCGGPGVVEALEARGVEVRSEGPADAVVVGWHRDFDYSRLSLAMAAVLGGARLIGTNDDATYPSPTGPLPGAGSLLAAVAYASGAEPLVAGKPNDPTVTLLRQKVGNVEVVVGDRPSTDGELARRLGTRFGLVLSGVTPPDHPNLDPEPDVEASDLASLVSAMRVG